MLSVDDLRAEVERLAMAARSGRVRSSGNWSVAQMFQHVGRLIEFSFDGCPFRYPWWLRWPARVLGAVAWRRMIALAFRPGFRNPPAAAALEPDQDVPHDTAAAYIRAQLDRVLQGEQMTQPGPIGDVRSHDQWVYVHLRHAELHLGFLHIDEESHRRPVDSRA